MAPMAAGMAAEPIFAEAMMLMEAIYSEGSQHALSRSLHVCERVGRSSVANLGSVPFGKIPMLVKPN